MACSVVDRRAHFVFAADPMAVRHALQAVFARLTAGKLASDACDTTQIVLAEALNNVVKHAYAQAPGEIEVTLELGPTAIICRIVDAGLPMPGGDVPLEPVCPMIDNGEVPEGGFGWHLIRTLSQEVSYRREGERNFLTIRIASQQSVH